MFPKLATCLRNLRCHIGLPYWHYQLVLSWYLHQPESHQLSFTKVSDRRTTGPIDRTPGTPGSDKKYNESGISIDELRGKWKPYKGVVDGFHNPSSCLRQSQSAQRARRTKSRGMNRGPGCPRLLYHHNFVMTCCHPVAGGGDRQLEQNILMTIRVGGAQLFFF